MLAAGSGALDAVISAGSGKLAQKLGITDAQTLMAGGEVAATNKGLARRVGEGALIEGALEETPQSMQEQMMQNLALGKDPMEGVGTAAAAGLLSGGVMGGGMGALHKAVPAPIVEPPPVAEPDAPVTPVQPIAPEPATPYPTNIQQDGITRPVRPNFTMDLGGKEVVPYQQGKVATIPPAPEIKPNSPLNNALVSAGISTQPQAAQLPAVVSDAPATNNVVNDETGFEQPQAPALAQLPKLNAPLSNAVETATPAPVEPPAPIIPQAAPRSRAYDPEQVKCDAEAKAKLAAIANEPNRPTVRPLEDERIEPHAEILKNMAKDVIPNGGVTIMPDGSRTPSVNPDWYQGLRDALPTANLTPKAIEIAVSKAAEGKPLYKNQEAIVTAMLDHIDGQIEDNQPSELDRAFNRLAPHIPEEHFNELVDEARTTEDPEKFTKNLNLIADHYENKQNPIEPLTSDLSVSPTSEETQRDNADVQSFNAPVVDASDFSREANTTDSVTQNEQSNPIVDNENSPNQQPNDYGNPMVGSDNATDKSASQPSHEDFAVTDFTPTHELPDGTKVKLETNTDGEKYFVESDGSEWNYDDNAEAITNEKDNTPSDMGIGTNGILGRNETSETASATAKKLDSQAGFANQTNTSVENGIESQTPETSTEDSKLTQPNAAPAPEPILNANNAPFSTEVMAKNVMKKRGLTETHDVIPFEGGHAIVPTASLSYDQFKALPRNQNFSDDVLKQTYADETSNNESQSALVPEQSDVKAQSEVEQANKPIPIAQELDAGGNVDREIYKHKGQFVASTGSERKSFNNILKAKKWLEQTSRGVPFDIEANRHYDPTIPDATYKKNKVDIAWAKNKEIEQSAKNAQSNLSNNSSSSEIPNSSTDSLEKQHHVADIYKNASIADIEKQLIKDRKRADQLAKQGAGQMLPSGTRSTQKAVAGEGARKLYGKIQDIEGYVEARKKAESTANEKTAKPRTKNERENLVKELRNGIEHTPFGYTQGNSSKKFKAFNEAATMLFDTKNTLSDNAYRSLYQKTRLDKEKLLLLQNNADLRDRYDRQNERDESIFGEYLTPPTEPMSKGVKALQELADEFGKDKAKEEEVKPSKTQSNANAYTKESLNTALQNAADKEFGKGWFARLWQTSKFKIIDSNEAKAFTNDTGVQAFYHNGTTYFVADGIASKTDLVGLLKHEISIHALKMGKDDAGFKSILNQIESMRGKNAAIDKAFKAAERAGTPAENLLEEVAGYLVEQSPELKLTQRLLAWARNAIRKLTGDRFANNLTPEDLVYIATNALKSAPNNLNRSENPNSSIQASKAPPTPDPKGIKEKLISDAAPFRHIPATREAWNKDFPDGFADTPIGKVKLGENQFEKLIENKRDEFIGLIKPTLESPTFVVKNERGAKVFVKVFTRDSGRLRGFASISYGIDGMDIVVSNHPRDLTFLAKETNTGQLIYSRYSTLDSTKSPEFQSPLTGGLDENIPQSPDDSIKFSKTQSANDFEIPEETMSQKQQRLWQDMNNRWTSALNAIKAKGGKVNEANNVYSALERMPHIAAERITDFSRGTMKPLIERVARAKTNFDDIATLLYATHAPERNAEMQKINPRFKNGNGSGMTDDDAKLEIQKLKAKYGNDFAKIEAIAKDFQAITQQTAKMLEQSGAISQDEAARYSQTYQNYVPLKGFEKLDEKGNRSNGNGLGTSTAKKFGKRALGRESRAGQILENIIRDHERAIVWQGKAEVGAVVEQLINDNPDTIGTVNKIQLNPVVKNDKVSSMIAPFDPESEIRFLRNGREVRIQLDDDLLLQSYNRLGESNLNGVFVASAQLNRFLRQMWTQKNPAFFLINPIRDIQTAAVVLTGEGSVKLAAKAMKQWGSSWKTMLMHATEKENKLSAEERDILKRYRESGGSVGTAYISSLEVAGEKLHHELARHGGETFKSLIAAGKYQEAAKTAAFRAFNNRLFDLVENVNIAFEGATRLATFKAAIDSGYSDMQAASLSSNVTVNFTKRGELGQQLGAMYLFANANIQGTANIFKTLTESNYKGQAWGIVGGIVALSFMATMMGGDDGEDDLVSDYEKERNISIDIGDGKRITIPVAYGWSWFKDIGRAMAQMANGGDAEKISTKLASSFLGNFSPVGNPIPGGEFSGDNALVAFAPTATKPFIMPTMNKGAFGTPLMPESPFKPNQPDSEKVYRKTRGGWQDDIAKGLNSMTGGDSATSGWIDVSPETIKNTINYIAGGAGRFVTDSADDTVMALSDNESVTLDKFPIAKSFVKSESIDDYRRRFYTQSGDVAKVVEQLATYKKNGEMDDFKELYSEKGKLIALNKQATATKKMLQNLRDREDIARANGNSTNGIEAQQQALLVRFDRMFVTRF